MGSTFIPPCLGSEYTLHGIPNNGQLLQDLGTQAHPKCITQEIINTVGIYRKKNKVSKYAEIINVCYEGPKGPAT